MLFEKIVEIRQQFDVALLLVEQNVRRALSYLIGSAYWCVAARYWKGTALRSTRRNWGPSSSSTWRMRGKGMRASRNVDAIVGLAQ